MSEVHDRLIRKMKENNLKQVDLINALEVSRGTVSKWVSGINTPSAVVLPRLASLLKTTPAWLMHGDIPGIEHLIPVESWDENTPLEDDEVEIPFFEDFSFACGSGSIGEAMATETRKLRLSKSVLRSRSIDKGDAIATLASGDSMSPTICNGDTIHIDMGKKTIKDGKIFSICHGGLFLAKRLYNLPMGGVRIVSDNHEEYPEVQLTAQEVIDQQFEIIGWVWQISSMDTW